MARKRKPGARYPSGRLKHPTVAERQETDWEMQVPALERRCLRAGIAQPTHADLLKAKRAGAMLWGQWWLGGVITERQFLAADAFHVLRREMLKAIGAPSETARGVDLLAAGARSGGAAVLDTRKPEIALYGALRRSVGGDAIGVLIAFNCQMYVNPVLIRRALDLAADHLRIVVGKDS